MKTIKKIINNENLFVYLLALILSTLFIGYAPSSIGTGIFIFLSLVYFIINKTKIVFSKPLILLIVLYVFLALTYFWTIDIPLTKRGISRLITMALIPLAFHFIPLFKKNQALKVVKYFSISNVLYALFFLLYATYSFILTKDKDVFFYHDLVKILDLNAIYASVFFSTSLMYFLFKKQKSIFDKFSILILSLSVILLSSKLIILIDTLFVLTVFMISKKNINIEKSKLIIVSVIGIVILFFALSKLYERFETESKFTKIEEVLTKEKFNKVYMWTGTSFRLFQLRLLKEQIEEDNIFWKGFGLFASRVDLEKKHKSYNTYKGFYTYNYHNQYAQIMAESGIIGFLILIIFLFLNFKNAYLSLNYTFIYISFILIVTFFTESFLWVQRGLIFTTIFTSLFNRTKFTTD